MHFRSTELRFVRNNSLQLSLKRTQRVSRTIRFLHSIFAVLPRSKFPTSGAAIGWSQSTLVKCRNSDWLPRECAHRDNQKAKLGSQMSVNLIRYEIVGEPFVAMRLNKNCSDSKPTSNFFTLPHGFASMTTGVFGPILSSLGLFCMRIRFLQSPSLIDAVLRHLSLQQGQRVWLCATEAVRHCVGSTRCQGLRQHLVQVTCLPLT